MSNTISIPLGFGSFGPISIGNADFDQSQLDAAKTAYDAKQGQLKRRRELERARISPAAACTDGDGNTWTYVLVDNSVARITGCEPNGPRLEVPAILDGHAIYGIGAGALSTLPDVEEIMCADGIEAIGASAFRGCPRLRKLVLPASVAEFSASWVLACPALEELVLPGRLDTVTSDVFAAPSLRLLRIGPAVHTVKPGAFANSQLEALEVSPDNPYIRTDGKAVYSKDGTAFIALARPLPSYVVAATCTTVAEKACCELGALERIELPDSLLEIGPFAFARTGLASFRMPAATRAIGRRAFFHCAALASVELADGLETIGDCTFAETPLEALHIPASVQRIGAHIVAGTRMELSGPQCGLSIDPRNERYFLDGNGGLYRRDADGLHLQQLVCPHIRSYRALDGTRAIDERACALHEHIERFEAPEGVAEIGAGAFRVCRKLCHVELADTVRSIGDEAFIDTSIERFRVPRALEHLGEKALVTAGAHRDAQRPSLAQVEVATGNSRFFVHCGVLYEHRREGARAIVFTNSQAYVELPADTVSIAPYAFSNAHSIDTLHLNAQLATIGGCGLNIWSWIRCVRVDVAVPIEGRTSFELFLPKSSSSIHGFMVALSGFGQIDIRAIMAQYDTCIIAAHNFRAGAAANEVGVYEQAKLAIARLTDPVLLTRDNRKRYDRLLGDNLAEICREVARHDDRQALTQLADLGYLNADNLNDVVEAVSALKDAAMTAHLLEMRRLRFGSRTVDFDL